MISTTCGCSGSYCLRCFRMVAASKNGLDEAPNTTLVILSMCSFLSFSSVGGPENHRNLTASRSCSESEICRNAFLMSAMYAISCSLNLINTLIRFGFRLGPVRRQLFSEGLPSSWDEASNTTRSFVVTLSSLSTA